MLFVNSKYVLLTYAQCGDLDEWVVSNYLSSLDAECIVAREVHKETGGVHLHVFVDFGRKFRSRNVRIFDVEGRHPNVSPSRGTPEKGYDYAIKDGDVVAGGLARPEPRGGMSSGAEKVSNVAHLCEDADEFFELFDEMDRKGLIKGFVNAAAYAKWRYRPEVNIYVSPPGFIIDSGELDGRAEWVAQAGIGLGVPLLESPDAEYAVFDDMRGGIQYFHMWKDWLGCQREFMVKEMYKDPRVLKWGKPSIWLSNKDPREEMRCAKPGQFDESDIAWLEANCIFVEISSAIFRANTE
uniref:Replication-associated protein n=1 Tax=Turdus hortulorum Genomoviridae sp. TaxID=2814995 RepID=A0A8E7G261_9VIRU